MKPGLLYKCLLVIYCIFSGFIAKAQDEDTKKFLDSLNEPPPQVSYDSVAAVVDSAATESADETADDEASIPVDTLITSNIRNINADSLALIKKDKGFYYQQWLDSLLRVREANLHKEEKPPPKLPDFSGVLNVFQVILWVFAGAILLFVLYKLFISKSGLFIKNSKNIDAVIDVDKAPIETRYDALIAKAESENNYRLAVRYLHLQALYNLSEKGLVKVATEKTNYQYLNELRSAPATIVKDFSDLTYKYEYIWYGEYPLAPTMYQSLRKQFTTFNKEIEAN